MTLCDRYGYRCQKTIFLPFCQNLAAVFGGNGANKGNTKTVHLSILLSRLLFAGNRSIFALNYQHIPGLFQTQAQPAVGRLGNSCESFQGIICYVDEESCHIGILYQKRIRQQSVHHKGGGKGAVTVKERHEIANSLLRFI